MLELKSLSTVFPGFQLGPVTLSISRGATGLVGPNGAGKTTLLRAASGLLPGTAGTVALQGARLDDLGRRQNIAFAGSSISYYSTITFADHLRFLRAFYAHWSLEIEGELITRFSLPLNKRIGDASSGMVAKFALLLAFAQMAPAVFFDEPWNALDPTSRFELTEELNRLRGECERIVVISSHDLNTLQTVASTVIFLHEGRVASITDHEQLESAYREIYLS